MAPNNSMSQKDEEGRSPNSRHAKFICRHCLFVIFDCLVLLGSKNTKRGGTANMRPTLNYEKGRTQTHAQNTKSRRRKAACKNEKTRISKRQCRSYLPFSSFCIFSHSSDLPFSCFCHSCHYFYLPFSYFCNSERPANPKQRKGKAKTQILCVACLGTFLLRVLRLLFLPALVLL